MDLTLADATDRQTGSLRLRIFAPMIGSLLYELRSTDARLQVLNYQEGYYWEGPNTEATRRDWIGLDLTLQELQHLLRGELPEVPGTPPPAPQEAGPQVLTNGTLRFEVMWEQGRLKQVTKFVEDFPEYQVDFLAYSDGPKGLPRRLRIEDEIGLNRIVLALTSSERTQEPAGPPDFTVPESLEPFDVSY